MIFQTLIGQTAYRGIPALAMRPVASNCAVEDVRHMGIFDTLTLVNGDRPRDGEWHGFNAILDDTSAFGTGGLRLVSAVDTAKGCIKCWSGGRLRTH